MFILYQMIRLRHTLVISLLLLSSCSFNKIFLRPDKLPQMDKLVLPGNGDTSVMYFEGKNFQPVVKDTKGNLKQLEYTIESAVIKSKSGNNIHGWFLKPLNMTPDVTLLFLHGNAGNVLSQFAFVKPLVKHGFQVFLFDYSGFGFSTGKATVKNAKLDANSALAWLKKRPEVAATKFVIYGQSYGGHLSFPIAQENEKQVDGLVAEGAFSSQKDMAAYSGGIFGRIIVKQHYSALRSIKKFHKPVLIIHSTEDETVPYYMGEKLYAAANQPKSFYEIKGRHIYGPLEYSDSIANKIRNMLK